MLKKIARGLTACATVAAMLLLAGCAPKMSATATEREICIGWADSLFRPSRKDTYPTAVGLTRQYDQQAAYCPGVKPK